MITPLDIQEKEFSRVVRGYKENEVDEFLDRITLDYENILNENEKLKAEIERLKADVLKYSGTESTVLETLEAAKALMGDISASAERRAEILMKNAELDAELVLREARESVERLNEENFALKTRFLRFQGKYKALLEAELERFDTLSAELFAEMGGMESQTRTTVNKITAGLESRKPKTFTRIADKDLAKTIMISQNEIKE